MLTGPPACGKNTIGAQLGKRLDRCAVIEADALRRMVVHPTRLPWEGDEGHKQSQLGIDNACALAHNFHRAGFNVVISDALTTSMLDSYRKKLDPISLHTILVLPSKEEVTRRVLSRPDYLSQGQLELLYAQQEAFGDYDEQLDNTDMSIEQAVDWVLERWPNRR